MKFYTYLLAAFVILFSSCTKDSTPIRIGSFNNQCDIFDPDLWPTRLQLVRQLFDEEQFDVVGMQEPFWNQMADMEKILPEYGWVGLSTDGKPSEGYWHYNPIFYRKDRIELINWGTFWLSETPEVPGSKSWDTGTSRFCTWAHLKDRTSGKDFFEFNAHFDNVGENARIESAKLIVQKTKEIAGEKPFYFNGDLNVPADSEPYRILSSALVDSYHSCQNKENADIPSYNAWSAIQHSDANENIDHLFISPNSNALHWKLNILSVDSLYPSDHFPIVVDWQI